MRVVGIDLAWSDRNPSAGCAVEASGQVVEETPLGGDVDILSWIAIHDPTVVAIDAPLHVPNDTGMRDCERALHTAYGARGAGAHPSNRSLLTRTSGRVRGEDLARALTTSGYGDPWADVARTVLEVYPHPGLIEVFGLPERLRYKRVPAAQRPGALRRLRDLLEGLEDAEPPLAGPPIAVPFTLRGRAAKALEDRLDARFCAWSALVWAHHGAPRFRMFGDAGGGHVAVPLPSA